MTKKEISGWRRGSCITREEESVAFSTTAAWLMFGVPTGIAAIGRLRLLPGPRRRERGMRRGGARGRRAWTGPAARTRASVAWLPPPKVGAGSIGSTRRYRKCPRSGLERLPDHVSAVTAVMEVNCSRALGHAMTAEYARVTA